MIVIEKETSSILIHFVPLTFFHFGFVTCQVFAIVKLVGFDLIHRRQKESGSESLHLPSTMNVQQIVWVTLVHERVPRDAHAEEHTHQVATVTERVCMLQQCTMKYISRKELGGINLEPCGQSRGRSGV